MVSEFTIERYCWTSDLMPESGSQELHCELPWLLPTPMQKLWLEKEPWMPAADTVVLGTRSHTGQRENLTNDTVKCTELKSNEAKAFSATVYAAQREHRVA